VDLTQRSVTKEGRLFFFEDAIEKQLFEGGGALMSYHFDAQLEGFFNTQCFKHNPLSDELATLHALASDDVEQDAGLAIGKVLDELRNNELTFGKNAHVQATTSVQAPAASASNHVEASSETSVARLNKPKDSSNPWWKKVLNTHTLVMGVTFFGAATLVSMKYIVMFIRRTESHVIERLDDIDAYKEEIRVMTTQRAGSRERSSSGSGDDLGRRAAGPSFFGPILPDRDSSTSGSRSDLLGGSPERSSSPVMVNL